jgi:xanthine dehydrogenase YagS FAD-binding subunit
VERFEFHRAKDTGDALRWAQAFQETERGGHYIAGGTNLVDYMTLDVMKPAMLIDINGLRGTYGRIEVAPDRLRLGALVHMAEAEDHPGIRRDFPVLQQALALSASRQIRNVASLGGNLLQRTRCEYFRERSWRCNKRNPGSGCDALGGVCRQHAVLGISEHCIAAYAGDFGQALIALDATIETIQGPSGSTRKLPFADLHRLPGDSPHIETNLRPGELITFIEVPAAPWLRRSRYVKIRDRQSYQFALASAAVALDMDAGVVREARIALGGVATVPWRAKEAEAYLKGKPLSDSTAAEAAQLAFADAHSQPQNAFKVILGQRTLVRALRETREMQIP